MNNYSIALKIINSLLSKKMTDFPKEKIQELIDIALNSTKYSYCPYSNYSVGAALLGESGKIYPGCNVENSSYPAGFCAERCAVSKAIIEGEKRISAIAVCGFLKGRELSGKDTDFAYPCGLCRQVLREFCDPKKMIVISFASKDNYKLFTLEDILPHSFGPEHLDIKP